MVTPLSLALLLDFAGLQIKTARYERAVWRLMMAGAGAFLQGVGRAAVRALGHAIFIEFQKHARMRRPQRHGRVRAVGRQVFTVEFDRWLGGVCHLVMLREAVLGISLGRIGYCQG